jgi:hypothetical protein
VTTHSNGGFDRYVERLTRQVPRSYLERLGLRIEATAKSRVNVDTGTLRRSIGSQMRDENTVAIGSRGGVYYAAYQDVYSRYGNRYLTSAAQDELARSAPDMRALMRPRP